MATVGGLDEGGAPAAGIVAGAFALDLDDVGAEVGEDLARPRPGENAGEFEDAQASERTGHSFFSEQMGGPPAHGAYAAARAVLPAGADLSRPVLSGSRVRLIFGFVLPQHRETRLD